MANPRLPNCKVAWGGGRSMLPLVASARHASTIPQVVGTPPDARLHACKGIRVAQSDGCFGPARLPN